MKKLYFLAFPLLLQAFNPFNSPKAKSFDLSCFNTKLTPTDKRADENPKIRCRYICDEKLYTQQKIADAISFYKHSRDYRVKE
jgi:hypothetical protein